MPEVQEVFRMATQKVDQEPGALDRQVVRQRRAVRNRRLGAFATAAIFVAIAVAAYALTRSDKQVVPVGLPPSTSKTTPTANGSMLDLRTGKITPLPASIAASGASYAVSRDQTAVAYTACCNTTSPLYVANVDGTQARPISAIGLAAYAAQWSPDGSMLVYQQRDSSNYHLGNLFVQNVATGQRTQVTNLDQTQGWNWWFTFPSFAPDGRSILFHLPRGQLPGQNNRTWDLWSVPVTGGKQTLVQRNAGWGGYSPDGKWLAYLSPVRRDFTGAGLWITSVHGGTPRALVSQGSLVWLRWSPDGTRISYSDGDLIYVLNVATGSATKVAKGGHAEWFDDNTLIVANPEN